MHLDFWSTGGGGQNECFKNLGVGGKGLTGQATP